MADAPYFPANVIHPPGSAYAKERVKWEAQASMMGPGLRPYVKADYPMVLYRGLQRDEGGIVLDPETITVDTEAQRTLKEQGGWRATPLEALGAIKAQNLEFAKLAAEGHWEERRMSPGAQAEATAARADFDNHLPSVPETPHGLRGEVVLTDREIQLQAERDQFKAMLEDVQRQLATATPIAPKRTGWPKGKPRGKRATAPPPEAA